MQMVRVLRINVVVEFEKLLIFNILHLCAFGLHLRGLQLNLKRILSFG